MTELGGKLICPSFKIHYKISFEGTLQLSNIKEITCNGIAIREIDTKLRNTLKFDDCLAGSHLLDTVDLVRD